METLNGCLYMCTERKSLAEGAKPFVPPQYTYYGRLFDGNLSIFLFLRIPVVGPIYGRIMLPMRRVTLIP